MSSFYTTHVFWQYWLCRADQACLRILRYNGSSVTWTVSRLTTAKFKPITALVIEPRHGLHSKPLLFSIVTIPTELGPENDCWRAPAAYTKTDTSSSQRGRPTKTRPVVRVWRDSRADFGLRSRRWMKWETAGSFDLKQDVYYTQDNVKLGEQVYASGRSHRADFSSLNRVPSTGLNVVSD
jgi:hypothetical protein